MEGERLMGRSASTDCGITIACYKSPGEERVGERVVVVVSTSDA